MTRRRSPDRATAKLDAHRFIVWTVCKRLSFGELKTDRKSNEIATTKDLPATLSAKDTGGTMDALGS